MAKAGIRKRDRRDFVVFALDGGSAVAGVFPKYRLCAAAVQICREHLGPGPGIRALVVNAGNANAATGVKLSNGVPDLNRFGYGAGHANPTAAAAVKLVYDADFPDYLGFMCGIGLLYPSGGTRNAFGFIAP